MTTVVVTPGAGLSLASVLAQATSGFGAAGVPALEPERSDLGPGRHLAHGVGGPGQFRGGADDLIKRVGPGPGSGPTKGNDGRAVRKTSPTRSQRAPMRKRQAVVEKLLPWERLSSGLERAWEPSAGHDPASCESQSPTARGQPSARANGRLSAPHDPCQPRPGPSRRPNPAPSPLPRRRLRSRRRVHGQSAGPETTSRVVDAALEGSGRSAGNGGAVGPLGCGILGRAGPGRTSGRDPGMVAVVGLASGGHRMGSGLRGMRRRRLASTAPQSLP